MGIKNIFPKYLQWLILYFYLINKQNKRRKYNKNKIQKNKIQKNKIQKNKIQKKKI